MCRGEVLLHPMKNSDGGFWIVASLNGEPLSLGVRLQLLILRVADRDQPVSNLRQDAKIAGAKGVDQPAIPVCVGRKEL